MQFQVSIYGKLEFSPGFYWYFAFCSRVHRATSDLQTYGKTVGNFELYCVQRTV